MASGSTLCLLLFTALLPYTITVGHLVISREARLVYNAKKMFVKQFLKFIKITFVSNVSWQAIKQIWASDTKRCVSKCFQSDCGSVIYFWNSTQ